MLVVLFRLKASQWCSLSFWTLLVAGMLVTTPVLSSVRGSAIEMADSYLNIPYRDDGAINLKGEWVRFASPQVDIASPGLNCSGFIVDFARSVFQRKISLLEASHDRLSDSGVGARLGQDWDFGRDLILNITQGREPLVVMPRGVKVKNWFDGLPLRGFNLHDEALVKDVLGQLESKMMYFVSISKPWRKKKGYRLIHYHVGVILVSDEGAFFYHTTRLSKTHKYNLRSKAGLAQFAYQFRPSQYGDKHMLVIGVKDPL